MTNKNPFEDVDRATEVFYGIASMILGAILLLASLTFVLSDQTRPALIAAGVMFLLGLSLGRAGVRLTSGEKRNDGGLFSPIELFAGAIIFAAGGVLGILSGVEQKDWIKVSIGLFGLIAAIAAVRLAIARKGS